MPKMIALSKSRPAEGATLEETDIPVPGPGEVLLRVKATSICGTDLHIWKWDAWASKAMRPPIIFGHEFSGEVVELGSGVKSANQGDFASVESHIPCDRCDLCRTDQRHICTELKIFGIDRNGSFAEYVTVPEVCLWKHSRPIAPELASIMEPLGNAVHAVSAADVKGKRCMVFGCGPIGVFAIQVAKAMGATRVVASDIDPYRNEMAREAGADEVLNGKDADAIHKLRGFDVTFDMAGAPQTLAAGLRALRNGGAFVAFGLYNGPVSVDLTKDLILSGRRMIGIVGRHMFKTWAVMQELLDARRIRPEVVITHRFPLREFERAFSTILSRDSRCGKVVMFP